MTEKELKALGFEFVKRYEHNQFATRRFKKGVLEVELTFEKGRLIDFDLTIEEVNCLQVTKQDLKELDSILNKTP